jgi:hypothetical protein
MGLFKGIIIFIGIALLLMGSGFLYVRHFNKVNQLLIAIASRQDILFKALCRIDFIYKDENDSDENTQIAYRKMNLYVFNFGIVLTTVKEPLIIKDEEVLFFYNDNTYINEFKPINCVGRLGPVELTNNQIKFRSILRIYKYIPIRMNEWDCSIFLNSDDFEKIKTVLNGIKLTNQEYLSGC